MGLRYKFFGLIKTNDKHLVIVFSSLSQTQNDTQDGENVLDQSTLSVDSGDNSMVVEFEGLLLIQFAGKHFLLGPKIIHHANNFVPNLKRISR